MKIGVIADDLTGANATGVRLAKNGFTSATVVFGGPIPHNGGVTAISIDTDSRYVEKELAQQRVRDAYQKLAAWDAKVFAKRIDSTIRGNLGVETDTLLNELGPEAIAIVVASYPDSGRVTSGGYLLVDGIPVQETDVAKDPMNPITQSHVPTLFAQQSNYPVAHIGLDIVLQGCAVIKPKLEELVSSGTRIIVLDAVTNEEIDHIAEAMAELTEIPWVPVDPGPLTATYGRLMAHQSVAPKKWIFSIGSITPLTGRQLRYLMDKTNAKPVYVDVKKLASTTDSWDTEIDRATDEGLLRLSQEDVLIITTYSPSGQVLNLSELGEREGVTSTVLAKRITEGLATISTQIMTQTSHLIGGTFSSGGDVTAAICSVSQAEAIGLEDEVIPLAAYGTFIGGKLDGIPVVTKGGMVGDKQSIYQCFTFLKTKNQEGSGEE